MNILVMGGNRYFGKKLVDQLTHKDFKITVLNRGSRDHVWGKKVEHLKVDRSNFLAMQSALKDRNFDLVYDQICFDANMARESVRLFRGKTGRYIFTSSQSVYDEGANLKEEVFDPTAHTFQKTMLSHEDYAEAKRQAEAVFMTQREFSVKTIRFPIVLGLDDYTKRLSFHVSRVLEGKPIFFPNLDAFISFVWEEDAARFLAGLANTQNDQSDIINCASPKPMMLLDLMNTIEEMTGKKAQYAPLAKEDSLSPYGISNDWWMNVDKLKSYGFVPNSIERYLPDLIGRLI